MNSGILDLNPEHQIEFIKEFTNNNFKIKSDKLETHIVYRNKDHIDKEIAELHNKVDKILNQNKENPNWLNTQQVSEYTGISIRKIRELIKQNRIPFSKLDNSYRFNRNKINLWLEFNGQKLNFTRRDKNKLEILNYRGDNVSKK